ncbi:MAG: BON domain-containing protein [Pseudomonadota bacterium]
MKSDKQLQKDVMDDLTWDPSIDASKIGVSVVNGVVTLTGAVPSYFQKQNTERIVKRVSGVRAVANDIEVRLPSSTERNDSDIAQAALNALKWDTSVSEDNVKISVTKGWVTLEGSVDWNYQRESCEKAIEKLVGVKGVTNRVSVAPQVKAKDVKGEIKAALHRYAELEARNIEVDSADSTITLRGQVRSWAERKEAETAAWMAPGVTQVKNEIIVSV